MSKEDLALRRARQHREIDAPVEANSKSLERSVTPAREKRRLERRRMLTKLRVRRHRRKKNVLKILRSVTPDEAKRNKRETRRASWRAYQRRNRARRRAKRLHSLQFPIVSLEDLIEALTIRRNELKMTQMDVDEKAGFQTSYTSKLEMGPHKKDGRMIGRELFPIWLQTLGVELRLVPAKKPRTLADGPQAAELVPK